MNAWNNVLWEKEQSQSTQDIKKEYKGKESI